MIGRWRVSEVGKENTTDESPPSFPIGSDNDRSKVKYGRGEKPEEQERQDVLWKAQLIHYLNLTIHILDFSDELPFAFSWLVVVATRMLNIRYSFLMNFQKLNIPLDKCCSCMCAPLRPDSASFSY
jgi:hypothetical protein